MYIDNALNLAYSYAEKICNQAELDLVSDELIKIAGKTDEYTFRKDDMKYSYSETQNMLSKLNEKESIRKSKGVYYTPCDVVHFIVVNKKIPLHMVHETVRTIFGNDINEESIAIAKIRILLCILRKVGAYAIDGLANITNPNFYSYDYIVSETKGITYDIIVGNPPYVEDFKSGLQLSKKYGNIYANVLINATNQLSQNGSMGFIIPLSYISTPRMSTLRDELFDMVSEQYILSYADRPDCLFDSVHQKLCILIGKQKKDRKKIYTGNYQYWYKEERKNLFKNTQVIRNAFYLDNCIPKLGTELDIAIFKKITDAKKMKSVYEVSRNGDESVYLNRREAFWMKAYREKVDDPEYKIFSFESKEEADYCYCLINSSLFWWYWISTSDCWHVSKELNGFMAPFNDKYEETVNLAHNLRQRLEDTKVYVGTKQTEYEYKHRECIKEIHAIDTYVNDLFGLTKEESEYIKTFAFRYRTSGGAE